MTGKGVLLIEPLGRGGVWEYTCRLSNALQEHAPVTILTGADYDPSFLGAGVTVLAYVRWQDPTRWWYRGTFGALLRRIRNAAAYWTAASRALRICPSSAYPIVHFQGLYWPPLVLATVVAARRQSRCVVYTPHNSFFRGSSTLLRWIWVWLQRWICQRVDIVIVHTRFDQERLVDLGIANRRSVSVIPQGPYGIPGAQTSRERARGRLGLPSFGAYILVFGYLRPDKGLDELFAVLPRLISSVADSRVLIAGEDVSGLGARLIDGLPADVRAHVEFRPGFVSSERMPDYFAASDVICLPYRQASDSAVARWALAQRKPIVAYEVGGLRDALDGNALIRWVRAGDRSALLRSLVEVLRNRDEPLGALVSEPNQPLLTWSDIAKRTLVEYTACLEGTPRA